MPFPSSEHSGAMSEQGLSPRKAGTADIVNTHGKVVARPRGMEPNTSGELHSLGHHSRKSDVCTAPPFLPHY